MNVEALKRENEQLHRDVQTLIAQIEWLQECTGEHLEDDDAVLFAQIKSRPGKPKFEQTFCSQCGREFGPGDNGYSHCHQHS